jgi:hypothetical protein
VDALVQAGWSATVASTLVTDVVVVLGCVIVTLASGAATLCRSTE